MAKKTSTKKPGNDNFIVNKIDVRPIKRTNQDIQKWRDALTAAEGTQKNRASLYNLYHDIELDTHLESVKGKIYHSIKNTPIVFTKDGKEVEEINGVCKSEDFTNLIIDFIDTWFWGYTLAEITNIYFNEETEQYELSYDLIPRKHVKPEFEIVAKKHTDKTGIPYKENKFCMWAGKKDDLGLYLKVAPWVLWKRGDIGDWAQFAELFGMPFREFKYKGYDDATRKELEKVAEDYGAKGYAIVPEESEFKLHQATTAASSNTVYKDLAKFCNEEISKAIVLQTMTTDNGSSKSQAEVHENVEDAVKQAARTFIVNQLNNRFKRILKLFGFDVKGGEFSFKEGKNLNALKTRLNIDKEVSQKVPVGDDYWYETYGIPKPENYEELKKQQQAAETTKKDEQEVTNLAGLNQFFNSLAGILSIKKKDIPSNYLNNASVVNEHNLTDAEENLLNNFKKSLKYDPATYQETVNKLMEGLYSGLGLTHEYGSEKYLTRTMMELNIHRFGFQKNYYEVFELNKLFRNTDNFNDFKQGAKNVLGKLDQYLETEYETAAATSQNAERWADYKQEKNTFPYLKYETAGDEKVRDSHRVLDGKIFKLDNRNSWQDIYPPNGYRCRCEMIQLRADEVNEATDLTTGDQARQLMGDKYQRMKEDGFAVNKGETKQIFDLNQGYINKLPGKKPDINNMDYKTIGLASFRAIKKKLSDPVPRNKLLTQKEAIRQFNEKKQPINGTNMVLFKDHLNRDVSLTEKSFLDHIKKTGRRETYQLIGTVLQNADEVYLTQKSKNIFNYRYIKFYNDRSLVVDLNVSEKSGLNIKTWYMPVNTDERRKGIKIK